MKIKILTLTLVSILSASFMANAETDSKDLSITLTNEEWIKVSQPAPISFQINAGSELTQLNASSSFCVTANSDYTLELIDELSEYLGTNTLNLYTKSYDSTDAENPLLLKRHVPFHIRLTHNKVVNGVSNPEFITFGEGSNGDYHNESGYGYNTDPDLDVNSFANNCVSKTSGETLNNYLLEVRIESSDLELLRAGSFKNKLTLKATNNEENVNCTIAPEEPQCQV